MPADWQVSWHKNESEDDEQNNKLKFIDSNPSWLFADWLLIPSVKVAQVSMILSWIHQIINIWSIKFLLIQNGYSNTE